MIYVNSVAVGLPSSTPIIDRQSVCCFLSDLKQMFKQNRANVGVVFTRIPARNGVTHNLSDARLAAENAVFPSDFLPYQLEASAGKRSARDRAVETHSQAGIAACVCVCVCVWPHLVLSICSVSHVRPCGMPQPRGRRPARAQW